MENLQLNPANRDSDLRSLKILPVIVVLVWTVVITTSLIFNVKLSERRSLELAHMQGQTLFAKDQAIRFWVAGHGGLYVPVSPRTQPNPALESVARRDIVTLDGEELTLMNPAYVIRQLNEDYQELFGIVGHITSKKLLREENAPDEWEMQALDQFENGVEAVEEVANLGDAPHLRFMSPMITTESCLKCHGHQGYKVGDVRGGVAISVPMAPFQAAAADQIRIFIISHLLIWLLGLTGVWRARRKVLHHLRARVDAEMELRNNELDMERVWNQLPIGVALVDQKKKIRLINPRALEILGLENDSPLGRNCMENLCDANTCPVWDSDAQVDGPMYAVSKELYPGKTIEKIFLPSIISGERMMLEVISDITQQTEANELIMKHMEDLERFNKLAMGRETRMIELKREVNLHLLELGRSEKYQPDREVYETT